MNKFFLVLVIFLLSCSEKETEDENETENTEIIEEEIVLEKPDRSEVIDESISAEIELEYGEIGSELVQKPIFALINGTKNLVKKYEGTFMKASGINGMLLLKFVPYSYWDDNLELEVKSVFDSNLELYLSKNQNDVLGFVDYSKATNNIAWDYFENLFTIYYYENDEGEAFPLNFINLGKTEWDG